MMGLSDNAPSQTGMQPEVCEGTMTMAQAAYQAQTRVQACAAHTEAETDERRREWEQRFRLFGIPTVVYAAPVIFEYARSNGCDGEEYWLSGYRIGNDREIRWRHINLPEILMKKYESGER